MDPGTDGARLYSPPERMLVRTFGELEAEIMRALWRRDGPATVREVHGDLARRPRPAYTTIMTVMERLWRKGILKRTPRGRAFEYAPVMSEAEYTANLMHELLAGTSNRRNALAHFVRGMKKAEEQELLRLAREASRRRGSK
jgi:predicted transcriptional regulator